jgi:hypothetical protein
MESTIPDSPYPFPLFAMPTMSSEGDSAVHLDTASPPRWAMWFPMPRYAVDDSRAPKQISPMGRPKQFDERIQLTLVDGTTGRIDSLLTDGEYRLDFIRTAIEAEIRKRSRKSGEAPLPTRKKPS